MHGSTIAMFVGIVIVVVAVATWYLNAAWCGVRASDMGVASKYTLVSGCLVSENQKVWVSPDKFRGVAE